MRFFMVMVDRKGNVKMRLKVDDFEADHLCQGEQGRRNISIGDRDMVFKALCHNGIDGI